MKLLIISNNERFESEIRTLINKVGWSKSQENGQIESIIFLTLNDNGRVIVAKEDNKIIGFISGQYYAWNNLGQIHGLVVDPDFRRKGVATKLVGKFELFLKQKGARGVYVDTPVDNKNARGFYEKCGYILGYLMPKYYTAQGDGVTYQKFWSTITDK